MTVLKYYGYQRFVNEEMWVSGKMQWKLPAIICSNL